MERLGSCRALVALSRNIHSIYALRLACQLSRLGHLKLDLVHVVENDTLPRGAGWAPRTWAREREQEVRGELEQLVQAELEFCDPGGSLVFEHGRPGERLLRRLNTGGYDLVILGGSPSGSSSTLLGQLARESPVPLLLTRGVRPLRRVLMATDGTPAAEHTLSIMGRLLGDSTVEIALVAAQDAGQGGNGAATGRARKLLQAEGVEPQVAGDSPLGWQALLAEAAEGDYDLLVVARAPGRGGALRDMLGGNPLLRLALHAPCPVLVQARGA